MTDVGGRVPGIPTYFTAFAGKYSSMGPHFQTADGTSAGPHYYTRLFSSGT